MKDHIKDFRRLVSVIRGVKVLEIGLPSLGIWEQLWLRICYLEESHRKINSCELKWGWVLLSFVWCVSLSEEGQGQPIPLTERHWQILSASQLLRFSSERLAEVVLSAETFSFSIILFLCYDTPLPIRLHAETRLLLNGDYCCSGKMTFFSTGNFSNSTCMNTDSFSMDCGRSQCTLWCTELYNRNYYAVLKY